MEPVQNNKNPRRRTAGLVLLAAGAAALTAYVLRVGFLGDDLQFLFAAQHANGFREVFDYVVQPLGASFVWRPFVNLFWFAEWSLFGDAAWAYHTVSLALFFCAAWLLYLIAKRFGGRTFALVAAVIFLVMPFHAEAIVWLSSVTDLLALLGSLATLYLFIRYRDEGGTGTLSLCAVTFFLALCSKEFALMTPVIALWIDVLFQWKRSHAWKPLARAYGTLAFVAALYLVLRVSVLGNLSGSNPGTTQSFIDALQLAPLKMSVGSFLYLFNHAVLSRISEPFADFWLRWRVYVSAVVLVLLFVLNLPRWKDARFWKLVGLSVGFIVLFSIPMLALLPHINENLQHSRFLYAPSVGVALLLATLLWQGSGAKKVVRLIGGTLLTLTIVVYAAGLAINLPPWVKATKVMTSAIDNIAANYGPIAHATTPTVLYIHAVPGAVDGAYAFHDLYSFRELFDLRFENPNVTVVPVGRYQVEQKYSLCATPATAVHLLKWNGSGFDDRDAVLTPWITQEGTAPAFGFDSTETFVRNGWKADDLMVRQTDDGVELSDFGDRPTLTVNVTKTTLPSMIRSVELALAGDRKVDMTIAWKAVGSTDYSTFQSVPFAAQGTSTLSLCAYPNWFVGGELGSLQLRFPKRLTGAVTIEHVLFR